MSQKYTRIKVCGLRSPEAAVVASSAGADYLGFVFVEGVRRQLRPDDGARITTEYRTNRNGSNQPGLVGLFRNQNADWVNETAQAAGLDYVELCGDEDEGYIREMVLPIFRQIRVQQGTTPHALGKLVSPQLNRDHVVVLDSYDRDIPGGTGRSFDWAAAVGVANRENVLLAGGLTQENVQGAIAQLSPWGVDVSSGVETEGVKDPERIRSFINAVRSA